MTFRMRWLSAGVMALVVLALALMATAPAAHAGRNHNPGVMPPQSNFHGSSQTEWGAKWLQWLLSVPADESPLSDPDGRFCHVGQSGPVFFLGSNFGGESVRDCTVRPGTPVLAAPGGAACFLHFDGETEEELRDCAQGVVSEITALEVDVDGVPVQDLEQHLVLTSLFSFELPQENLLDLPAGEYQAVLAEYILLFHPLPVGEHVIHMRDEFSDGFLSDVTYNITVSPRR